MTLQSKLQNNSAVVGVMALGYVGLPLLRAFWSAGLNVVGFDVDHEKIEQLKRGQNYLKHLGEHFVSDMAATRDAGRFDTRPDAVLPRARHLIARLAAALGAGAGPERVEAAQRGESIAHTMALAFGIAGLRSASATSLRVSSARRWPRISCSTACPRRGCG